MNENLYVNSHGLRLIQEYEGSPRLKARLCEGNSWELGYGITFDLNGNPFKEGDTCSPDEADTLFRNALQNVFEPGVRNLVTVPLNSNQFSGLTALAWNIGVANFASSSVLRRVNENRMDDAAACFPMWIFATAGNGHKQAMRGLLRRRFAEACLFMGYDWTQACDIDAIALMREIPETFPGTDRVIYRTPFKDVLMVAQRYPLAPADELVLTQPAPPLVATTRVPDGNAEQPGADPQSQPPVVSAPKVSPAPSVSVVPPASVTRKPEPVPASPAPPARAPSLPTDVGSKPPVVMPPSVQVNTQSDMGPTTKTMWVSKRFWGGVLISAGRLIIVADVGGHFSPAVKSFIGDGVLMDWMTGVIVTMVGELVLDQGEKKAKGPMDTPKRIALMTPAP